MEDYQQMGLCIYTQGLKCLKSSLDLEGGQNDDHIKSFRACMVYVSPNEKIQQLLPDSINLIVCKINKIHFPTKDGYGVLLSSLTVLYPNFVR